MAKPAFIHLFDELGPVRFVELCAELLGERYKGFILGGVGADGGIDAEIDSKLGEWHPKEMDALSNQIIESGQTVIFQFKHKVTARTGQANARTQILNLYRSANSEVTKDLILKKKPDVYVLITNIEVNSQFRDSFQDACRAANPEIAHYQIIGLDELENWVTRATNLRHLYFPTIFDLPRYNLKLGVVQGFYAFSAGRWESTQLETAEKLIQVMIFNIGTLPSYIYAIQFKVIEDGQEKIAQPLMLGQDRIMEHLNPKKGEPLEPGRSTVYSFRVKELKDTFHNMFLSEIIVVDEIMNQYSIPVPQDIRNLILTTK